MSRTHADWRRIPAVVLSALLCAGSAVADEAAVPMPRSLPLAQSGFALRPPAKEAVVFHGVVSRDADAGRASSMVYVIPGGAGVAGLIAAIATHGAVAESTRQSAISKAQAAADAVLEPYSAVLAGFSHRELMQSALAQLSDAGDRKLLLASDAPAAGWTVESTPVFTMTQDQSAIVLDNTIVVRDASRPAPVGQTHVRVVSNVYSLPDPQSMWLADNGRRLKDESVRLFAHSLHILLLSLSGAPSGAAEAPYKTFRYPEGNVAKMERARLVEHACERAVIRTLRDWLMSIPQPGTADEGGSTSNNAPEAKAACNPLSRYPS